MPDSESAVVYIARCPEHGLHGCRTHCFECGVEVEQVPMVEARVSDEMVERAARTMFGLPLVGDVDAPGRALDIARRALVTAFSTSQKTGDTE